MNLLRLCQSITFSDYHQTSEAAMRGDTFMGPKSSGTIQEIKYFPPAFPHRIYLFCWNFTVPSRLCCAMCPQMPEYTFTYHFKDGEKTNLHTHDFIELAYVVKGELRQCILEKDICFKEGELCLIDRNCIHQDYLYDSSSVILFLSFRDDVLAEIMNENFTTRKIITFLQTALLKQKELQQYVHFKPQGNVKEKMDECFFVLMKELLENRAGGYFIRKGIMIRIFRLLSTEYEFSLSKQQQKDMNWIVFEEVCRYIQEHYQTVTIQDLTKTFHFQEDYFNRLIKKRTGMTYCTYLQNERLKKAEQLLTQTKASVSEIAELVGYHNRGYFYKIFEKKYGMTPTKYRKYPH